MRDSSSKDAGSGRSPRFDVEDRFPLVTVITVVRNARREFEATAASVLSQNYPNLEYVVLDGGSSDGTVDAIRSLARRLVHWQSEPDNGIYDAMNKAVVHARGQWILFMNSGDRFYAADSLTNLSDALRSDAEVILAGTEKVLKDRFETRRFSVMPGPVEQLWARMPTSHQAVLVRRNHQQNYGFDTGYQWCADQDLLLRMYQDGCRFRSEHQILSVFDCAGGRQRSPTLFIRERWRLSRGKVSFMRRIVQFGGEFVHCRVWGPMVGLVRRCLPSSLVRKLRRVRGTSGEAQSQVMTGLSPLESRG